VFEDITPSNRKYPGIIFKPEREPGNQILNVQKLAKSVEEKVLFSDVSFDVVKGQKIAFLSRDPVALTSFFEIINNKIKPDSGHFEWGSTITTAYLPNDNSEYFENDLTLLDWLRQFVPPHYTDVDEDFLRGFLGKMLFSGDEIQKKTSVLSGGEKVRCMISKMMLQNPNLLMLDEPTNHLDLESITAFNDGMISFPGIVLMTTHDHQFMQTVANRIIEITPKGIIDRLYTYDEYLADDRIKALQDSMYN
jgi:ATPase subunit of ABC transporter with duplicated ATPase domains